MDQAQRDNATAPLDSLLADSFVDTGSDGAVRNKAGAIAGQKTVKLITADFDDVKTTAYGDTVIVTGIMNANAIELASGRHFENHETNTDTWVRMPNGHWQCVATQQTAVMPVLTRSERTAELKTMSTRRK
jgi:hypothetical protein